MKILLLSKYGRMGSSSRLRFYQYLDHLRDRGMKISARPLFDDEYVKNLYAGCPKNTISVIAAYSRRLAVLLNKRHHDLIWLEAELFPYLPSWYEAILSRAGAPLVVDYDDAAFHRYDHHKNGVVRTLLGNKVGEVMKRADLVITGNDYLFRHAKFSGAKRVEYLPTVIDLNRYPVEGSSAGRQLTIGWIGSPVTEKYLLTISETLDRASRELDCRIVLVGGSGNALPGLEHESRIWSESTEAAEIAEFDVGIMPLPDEPWERGKCGYKLIQYMAGCVPTVASPVGANLEIVDHGVNGFLADNKSEWLEAIGALAENPSLRERLGKAGRKKVEEEYCLQVTAPRLERLLSSL